MLPTLHDRLSAEIHYQPGVPEAMVAVIKDSSSAGDRRSSGSRTIIRCTCRNCATVTLRGSTGTTETGESRTAGADARTHADLEFVTAVLVAVEQEMRGEARSMLEPEPIRITVRGDATTTSA